MFCTLLRGAAFSQPVGAANASYKGIHSSFMVNLDKLLA
jgi:hypothetical protein